MKGKKPKHKNREGRKRADKRSVGLGAQKQQVSMTNGPTVEIVGTELRRTP